jgi:hypothetical protein
MGSPRWTLPEGWSARYLAHRLPDVHAIRDGGFTGKISAACGESAPARRWYGTGNQREYEVAARKRLCARCRAALDRPFQ